MAEHHQEFTKEQHEKLLKIIEAHDKASWLWATVGVWMKWAGLVLAALVAFKVLVQDFFRIWPR